MPTVSLSLDADTAVVGYWSDGTADVEINVTLYNSEDLGLRDAVSLAVTCGRGRETIHACGGEVSVSLPDGYGPATETLTIRVPTGEIWIEIDYGGENVETLSTDVPARIVGVDRRVWECFSDTSKAGTFREEDEGNGCAAWSHERVRKWDHASPVKVWLSGPKDFRAEFRDVLTDLSPVVNLQLEWVEARSNADVVAYVGLTVAEAEAEGVSCDSIDALGCAKIGYHPRSIVVYNFWPGRGLDFADFEDQHRQRFTSAMIHEAVHVFGYMRHRTELVSIMNSQLHHRAELTPMDEALLRLHGHELVKRGMAMADIERLIVFNDELLDPRPPDPRLQTWAIVSGAYEVLREATSARFRVRSSRPGCSAEFGWADYEVGNLTGRYPYFGWVRIDDGEEHFYVLRRSSDESQYWRQSRSGWEAVSRSAFSDAVPGWRGKLADPHHMLESVLYYADWQAAEVSTDSGEGTTLRFDLDMTQAVDHSPADSAVVVIVINEETRELLEYSMVWKLGDRNCDTYRVEATDTELGVDFAFPEDIRLGSEIVANCEIESLGFLSGNIRRSGAWARECGLDLSKTGYSRPYRFSLDDWSFVRFELSSMDDKYISLLSGDGSGDSSTVDVSASGNVTRRYRPPDEGQLHWAHVPLPPGSYTVEIVTRNRVLPGKFALTIAAQPTPPLPYKFKSVSATGGRTCGLLVDGTPLCWGISTVEGEGAEIPGGKFAAISSGRPTCALHEDGTPVCWDFVEEGDHTCIREAYGTTFCRTNDQPAPSSESDDREEGDSVLDSVTIGVIGGYFDQTPPASEKLVSLSTNNIHSCGLRQDGTAVCWGNNRRGEASPPAGETFVSVDTGGTHSCGLREDGTAVCWGADDYRGLLSVPETERFVSITAGRDHTCGLRRDGSIVCWGEGNLGVCTPFPGGGTSCSVYGRGDDFRLSPPEDERFASLGSGESFCALRVDGTPVCWPRTPSGLVPPPEGERFTSLSASSNHACGLREDGTAACWGADSFGQSSPPSGINLNDTRTAKAPVGLVSISTGRFNTCALNSDGAATCWGYPWWQGQFSDRYSSISSSKAHTCAVRLDGTAECRGSDRFGQSSPPPGEVFASVTGGSTHSCGLRADGTALCWGANYQGQSSPPTDEVFGSISSGY